MRTPMITQDIWFATWLHSVKGIKADTHQRVPGSTILRFQYEMPPFQFKELRLEFQASPMYTFKLSMAELKQLAFCGE